MAPPKAPHAPKRLSADDWLVAGARMLADEGPQALKAEPMARRMNTTKGSFYWHFRDLPDFHARLLARWERAALSRLAELDGDEDGAGPARRLRALAQAISDPGGEGPAVEVALRAWAAGHDGARAALGRVEAARHAALGASLSEIGIDNPEMARIIHAAAIGLPLLHGGPAGAATRRDAAGSLVDLVLALR